MTNVCVCVCVCVSVSVQVCLFARMIDNMSMLCVRAHLCMCVCVLVFILNRNTISIDMKHGFSISGIEMELRFWGCRGAPV